MTPASLRSRAGFTLVELLVAMILLVIVGGGMYQSLVVVQRVSRTQSERAAMQGGLRTGVQLAVSELQELHANNPGNTSDLTSMGVSLVRYRAMRGLGLTCENASATEIKVWVDNYSGYQVPATPRHDVLLFIDNDSTKSDDDTWAMLDLTAVANGTCPDGDPAYVLTVTAIPGWNATPDLSSVRVPGPMRTYEVMELGLRTQNGRDWLGLRSVSSGEEMSPLAGPLETGGVDFRYFDNATTETALAREVSMIEMVLRGQTDRGGNIGIGGTTQLLTDTVRVRVQLRNSR
ncbi:MAG: PilW family protein [Gemmatimonadales bacterium]